MVGSHTKCFDDVDIQLHSKDSKAGNHLQFHSDSSDNENLQTEKRIVCFDSEDMVVKNDEGSREPTLEKKKTRHRKRQLVVVNNEGSSSKKTRN
jgi:hypothetical protein